MTTVNADPDVNRFLKVVFVPNFNVKNAHLIYPAANLSEQISTAGKEASGTGNMKFMINGALTIGTLDGANVEMREEAGAENFFLFGLDEEEVERVNAEGYQPATYIERDPELAEVLDLIAGGHFTGGDTEILRPVVDSLRYHDPFLALADYRSYMDCQPASARPGRSPTPGHGCRSSTPPAAASSLRTGPSPNTAMTSGMWRRCR